jgi:hypothetical protein
VPRPSSFSWATGFYGTVTVYVPGPDAAQFHFSNALAVQLLKVLHHDRQ